MSKRPIPGSVTVDGRQFVYVECPAGKSFSDYFNEIGTFSGAPYPKAGGSINEEAVLTLSDGVRLHGLSYKGDLEGWGANIKAMCDSQGLAYGRIDGDLVHRSDGSAEPLSECQIEY